MFGIGKLLGGLAGGLLDKIGLGAIAPFVKIGLSALTGDWLSVGQEVFGLVSKFKGDFLDKAATQPPLGGFEQPFGGADNALSGTRVGGLLKGLSSLFRGLSSMGRGDALGGFGKIFNAFRLLNDSFGNNQLYTDRLSTSQYSNIRL